MAKDHDCGQISAFEFDVVRKAFRTSVREMNLAENQWAEHARSLCRHMTDDEPDQSIIGHIVGRTAET